MEYRKCAECGENAVARAKGRVGWRQLCLECLDRLGELYTLDRYICSVFGCSNAPDLLVQVDQGGWRTLLLCEQHFKKLGKEVKSYLGLPRWLTTDEDIDVDEEWVTFEMELRPEG